MFLWTLRCHLSVGLGVLKYYHILDLPVAAEATIQRRGAPLVLDGVIRAQLQQHSHHLHSTCARCTMERRRALDVAGVDAG